MEAPEGPCGITIKVSKCHFFGDLKILYSDISADIFLSFQTHVT